jgi:flagellar biosynthesis/type III secretory pathway protein FliH
MPNYFAESKWKNLSESQPERPQFRNLKVNVESQNLKLSKKRFIAGIKVANAKSSEPVLFDPENLLRVKPEVKDSLKLKTEEINNKNVKSFNEAELELKVNEAVEIATKEIATRLESEYLAKIENLEKSWHEIFIDFKNQHKNALQLLEEELLSFSLEALKKYVFTVTKQDTRVFTELTKHIFQKLNSLDSVVIRVSPEDYQMVQQIMSGVELKLEKEGVSIISDDSVGRGCIFEHSLGSINVNLEESFNRLTKLMLGAEKVESKLS